MSLGLSGLKSISMYCTSKMSPQSSDLLSLTFDRYFSLVVNLRGSFANLYLFFWKTIAFSLLMRHTASLKETISTIPRTLLISR